jgi:2-polyprenyl-3-methyl-5-hydroxy-6-metoxy-1,4-benzoquinol methylase
MNKLHFDQIKKNFINVFKDYQKEKAKPETSEAAFPAYSHTNYFINKLFWERIKYALKLIQVNERLDILDFGCGSGILSFILAKDGHRVIGIDIEDIPIKNILNEIIFPNNFIFIKEEILNLSYIGKFDIIYALDVLEHIENTNLYILKLLSFLKPNGKLIISGPTENLIYQIGRKIAGRDFTGHYHITNINKIINNISGLCRVKHYITIPRIFGLYKLYILKPY